MVKEEENPPTSSLRTSLSRTPCFKRTFLVSISSGLVAGFVYFMFTSKTRMACHVGYSTFFAVTIGYWAHCRYQYSVQKFTYDQIMAAAKDVNILDGTEESHVSKEKPELKSA